MSQVNRNDEDDRNKACGEKNKNSGPPPGATDDADKENHDSINGWKSEREALLSVIKEERERHSSLMYKVGVTRQAGHRNMTMQ